MRIFLMAFCVALAACGPEKSESGDTASVDAFAPTAGQWSWAGTQFDTDECNFSETFPASVIDATLWDLVLTDDGFTLDNDIWTADPIVCVVTEMDFSCDTEIVVVTEAWPEGSMNEGVPDAVYTTVGSVAGTFADAISGSVSLTSEMTCEGADCDAHGAESGALAPCATALSGSFVRSE